MSTEEAVFCVSCKASSAVKVGIHVPIVCDWVTIKDVNPEKVEGVNGGSDYGDDVKTPSLPLDYRDTKEE